METGVRRAVGVLAFYGDTAAASRCPLPTLRLPMTPGPHSRRYRDHDAFVRLLLRYRPDLATRVTVARRARSRWRSSSFSTAWMQPAELAENHAASRVRGPRAGGGRGGLPRSRRRSARARRGMEVNTARVGRASGAHEDRRVPPAARCTAVPACRSAVGHAQGVGGNTSTSGSCSFLTILSVRRAPAAASGPLPSVRANLIDAYGPATRPHISGASRTFAWCAPSPKFLTTRALSVQRSRPRRFWRHPVFRRWRDLRPLTDRAIAMALRTQERKRTGSSSSTIATRARSRQRLRWPGGLKQRVPF